VAAHFLGDCKILGLSTLRVINMDRIFSENLKKAVES
jgi:hypothetical protein